MTIENVETNSAGTSSETFYFGEGNATIKGIDKATLHIKKSDDSVFVDIFGAGYQYSFNDFVFLKKEQKLNVPTRLTSYTYVSDYIVDMAKARGYFFSNFRYKYAAQGSGGKIKLLAYKIPLGIGPVTILEENLPYKASFGWIKTDIKSNMRNLADSEYLFEVHIKSNLGGIGQYVYLNSALMEIY